MTVFEMGPRHCDQDNVAKKFGYTNARNGAFTALKATASQFGLTTSNDGYISVTYEWIDIFNSEDAKRLKEARRTAMRQPDLYKQLISDYANKQIPSSERLVRELHINQKYGILKEAADVAAQVFIASASFASMLDSKNFLIANETSGSQTENNDAPPAMNEETTTSSPSNSYASHPKLPNASLVDVLSQSLPNADQLDRIEVQLRNGKKAYLFIPSPLPYGEKARLKNYIDLLLEDDQISNESKEASQE